jgi:hypothetical protein
MSGDYRFFIKVHNGFPEHRKTAGLTDKAFRHLVEAWCFCSRNLTDGKVTKAQSLKLFTRKTLSELIENGWIADTTDAYEMLDYLDHQMSAAQVADLRVKRAEAGKLGGQAKANRVASATASAVANGKQTPSKPVADKDIDKDRDTKTTTELQEPSSAEPMDHPRPSFLFEQFWDHYPRKVGRQDAQRAWDKARRKVNPAVIQAAVERMATDPNLPDQQFIPHASTWLNRGGWDDAPYPPPSNGRASPTRHDENAHAVHRMQQREQAMRNGNQTPLEIGTGR